MTSSIDVPKANPNLTATGEFQFMNQPMLSQYLESEYSIFGNPAYNMPIGTSPTLTGGGASNLNFGSGMGMGMGIPGTGMMGYGWYTSPEYIDRIVEGRKKLIAGQYDIADYSSDRQTGYNFNERANQNIFDGHRVMYEQELNRLKGYIERNEMRSACALYDRIYKNVAAEVGENIDKNSNRFAENAGDKHSEHVKAQIEAMYEQITGSSLVKDIEANGSGAFGAGWDRAFGDGQNSAKKVLSYMTNDHRQYSQGDKMWEKFGNVLGNIFGGFCYDDGKAEIEHTTDY